MTAVYDVLLVEDEPVVREASERALGREGLSLDAVTGVEAAIERLGGAAHRVVLADIMLPGRSGLELLAWIQRERAALPVVMITGYATIENALRSLAGGAFDFVPKPFDVEELLGAVVRALAWARRGGATVPASGDPEGRELHSLGRHAWAAIDADGSATIGAGDTFAGLLEQPLAIELPDAGETVVRGRRVARVTDGGGRVHRVTSPLGGAVIARNADLVADPSLLDREPRGGGWLVRIIPTTPGEELGGELAGSAPSSRVPGREARR